MHSNNKAKLRSILTELLKVKNASSKIGKQLIKQTQELIRKENIYLQLKTLVITNTIILYYQNL